MSATEQTAEQQAEATKARQQADAEMELARATRYAEERGEKAEFIWVISNRVDDRTVLHEQDDAHPSGECFIGGSSPDLCFRTTAVDAAIRRGEAVVTPEPKDSRFKPVITLIASSIAPNADQPGEPTRLGRTLNPDLYEAGDIKQVQAAQDKQPDEIAVPAGVQKPVEAAEGTNSRRAETNSRS